MKTKNSFWLTKRRLVGIGLLIVAIVTFILIATAFFIEPIKVEGNSMLPNLDNGERVLISKRFNRYEQGDVIAFSYPKNPSQTFVKRVIGLAGEEVGFSGGKLKINSKEVKETYLDQSTIVAPERHWLVERGNYFVMGDNRDVSNDSRTFGQVPQKYIYGKVFFRYWPLSKIGFVKSEKL